VKRVSQLRVAVANQKERGHPVRAKLPSGKKHADKAARAPEKSSPDATMSRESCNRSLPALPPALPNGADCEFAKAGKPV